MKEAKVVLQGSATLDLPRQLATGVLGRGPQLLDAALRLARPALKGGDGVAERGALAAQESERTLEPDGMKQRDGQQYRLERIPGQCRAWS